MSNGSKFREIIDAVVHLDQSLGIKKTLIYLIIAGITIGIFYNFKSIVREVIVFGQGIVEDIHLQKMEQRDQMLTELLPILSDFRSEVRADRLLYFEYHNSKENLLSIPFKYVELVQQSSKYGIPAAPLEKYRNINAGAITNIYDAIKNGEIVYCSGEADDKFNRDYPGIFDIVNSRDGSKRHIYMSLPGIDTPIGMMILEWIDDSGKEPDVDDIIKVSKNYVSRINGLVVQKRL